MPKNTSYSLPKDSKAWLHALDSVSTLLPSEVTTDVTADDYHALGTLPLFALIVVVQNQALSDGKDLPSPIQAWADEQPNWQLIRVEDVDDMACVTIDLPHLNPASPTDDRISDVSVYRYLLAPTNHTLMHPEKKTAAAHIIDEQITAHLRHFLSQLPEQHQADNRSIIDCHILPVNHMLRQHKLACFDMDSTLIEQEVIVELAKMADVGDQVNDITESAMRGEIDFNESFAQRVALLEGLSTDVLDDICAALTPSAGARTTIATLKALGYHTVLVSGGFTYFANYIAKELGIDEVHANHLDIDEEEVTGQVQLPIINGERKAELVARIADRLGIQLSQVICVGDGANDLQMMAQADLGVAYHAKPIVQARADVAINTTGLEGVLYVLGYPTLSACD